mgnify:CR=1 FL=1
MKKNELLKVIDDEMLEKLFGFCYARTNDSYEAQELCSDIIFELVKAAHTDGSIDNLYPFIWRIARNVYADFLDREKRHLAVFYEGNSDVVFSMIAEPEQEEDDSDELLGSVYRRIAFLTRAYREVMILFYIDGLSTAEIAKLQGTSETAIRQRLFSARKKVRSEVDDMNEMYNRPVALDQIEYVLYGSGDLGWSDPRGVCVRQFTKHIIWLCHKKTMSAREIAYELNVPTVYVEEELEILEAGENGRYGLLRKLENGKNAINFILLDRETIRQANEVNMEELPHICEVICTFIEKNKEEYLSFPYLNRKIDLNLILWQQIYTISKVFSECVEKVLSEKYFADAGSVKRQFTVFGYVCNGKKYNSGWDVVKAGNVCGYRKIYLENINITRIRQHFRCDLSAAMDPQIQLALRAINGLALRQLSESEKEHAAKAIDCGYLYREGEMLYTKILVSDIKDQDRLFELSKKLNDGCFDREAENVAGRIADMIRRTVPEYLLAEWKFFNILASGSVLDNVVETLIERGVLIPPEDGLGAEGCWMSVAR